VAAIEIIDTHIHLDSEDYKADLPEVLERARAAGVTKFISVGAGNGFESASTSLALAEKYPFIWASVGIHPHDAKEAVNIEPLEKLASHPRVVAVGETGLDFFKCWAPKELQYEWFKAQVLLAKRVNKPLIIHCRSAAAECLQVVSELKAETVGGVFHCYSEDLNFAEKLRKINFLVSFPGTVTFKKAAAVQEAAKNIPLSQIMLETDGPFLAPEPYRGKRCESSYMLETARVIAKLKGITVEEVAEATTQNALNFFKLK
jgi:TatD DNase family protein